MAKAGMTISDAAHEWVREMNAYPQEMIETLMQEGKAQDRCTGGEKRCLRRHFQGKQRHCACGV